MPEYIEREALIAKFEELGLGENSIIEKHFANGVYAVIETFPAADVVVSKMENTTRHGKNLTKMNPVDEFICSECGLIMRDVSEVRIDEDNEDECYFEFEFKYCPNCGVKIKESE